MGTLCPPRNEYHHYGLWRPKVVFTIHNAEYGLERIGSAAYYCQRFTTVSPSYAGEVRFSSVCTSMLYRQAHPRADRDIWDRVLHRGVLTRCRARLSPSAAVCRAA